MLFLMTLEIKIDDLEVENSLRQRCEEIKRKNPSATWMDVIKELINEEINLLDVLLAENETNHKILHQWREMVKNKTNLDDIKLPPFSESGFESFRNAGGKKYLRGKEFEEILSVYRDMTYVYENYKKQGFINQCYEKIEKILNRNREIKNEIEGKIKKLKSNPNEPK